MAVVPDLDVIEDRGPCESARLPNRITQLRFHAAKEAFDNRVIPAFARTAHTCGYAVCDKKLAIFRTGPAGSRVAGREPGNRGRRGREHRPNYCRQ